MSIDSSFSRGNPGRFGCREFALAEDLRLTLTMPECLEEYPHKQKENLGPVQLPAATTFGQGVIMAIAFLNSSNLA